MVDQLVDRTSGRADTFFDGPTLAHVSFADPYCPELRRSLIDAARAEGVVAHETGTVVVIQGPRFSTRAESRWFGSAGWEVVNMTQYPEAILARELGMCYSGVALVTDYDAGLEGVAGIEPVTIEVVFKVLAENIEKVQATLLRAVAEHSDRGRVRLRVGCAGSGRIARGVIVAARAGGRRRAWTANDAEFRPVGWANRALRALRTPSPPSRSVAQRVELGSVRNL